MDDGTGGNDWTNPANYIPYYDWRILGYIDLICCVITFISNVLVILVLKQKKKTSPVDEIFIQIASIESLVVLVYVPRIIHIFIRTTLYSISEHRTYLWERISLYSFLAAFLFRAMAVWLAILLGVWRYIAVIYPLKARTWCDMRNTRIFIAVGYIFSIMITLPIYTFVDVGEIYVLVNDIGYLTNNSTAANNVTIYAFQLQIVNHPFWYKVTFFSYAVFQIIPSLILAIIIGKLIVALYEAKKSNKEMSLNSYHYDRTTIILILIVFLFAIAEIPNGIFALLCMIRGPHFFWTCYYYAIEICNTVIFISESFNFIIYYSISDQFRQTFKGLFSRTKTDNNEIALKIKAAQRYVIPPSGVDRLLGTIGNQSPNSRDVN